MWRRVVDKVSRYQFARKLRWRRLRPNLYGFTYHRVGDASACPFDRGVFGPDAKGFRDQVRFIKKRFDVIGVERLIRMHARGETPERPTAIITFDDGYVDNYEVAFPILKELGVPAVFYPPTAYVESDVIPWWDEIAWILRNATAPSIRLKGSDVEYALDVKNSERSIFLVLMLVKARTTIPMDEQIGEIRDACAPAGSIADVDARLFVTWAQLREMTRGGMEMGSHTHTHGILSHLDEEAQRFEMTESKAILESKLDRPIDSIAYPVGCRVAYTADTVRIARESGYALGFNFIGKINTLPFDDPLDVYRFTEVY